MRQAASIRVQSTEAALHDRSKIQFQPAVGKIAIDLRARKSGDVPGRAYVSIDSAMDNGVNDSHAAVDAPLLSHRKGRWLAV